MPAPGRPHRIVSAMVASSSRVCRRLAPFGASSRSFSPLAKAPWHSEQPEDRHTDNPAFALVSSCAWPAVEQASTAATASTAQSPTPNFWCRGSDVFTCMQGPFISFNRLRALLGGAARPIDLEARGAFELVFGEAVLVGVDGELARLVVAPRLDAGNHPARFAFANLLDQQVVDRPLALGGGQIVAIQSGGAHPLEDIGQTIGVDAASRIRARVVDDP